MANIVDNKKFKKLTFKRKNGKIALFSNGKRVGGARILQERLEGMKSEVKHAEAGQVITTMKDLGDKGNEFKRHGIKSTFPKWFGAQGFKSKKEFLKVANAPKGIRKDRLVNLAIKDLSEGHDSSFGPVPADTKFRVKTRQAFNNKDVVFRRIRGRIVPIRINKKKKKLSDEVPF